MMDGYNATGRKISLLNDSSDVAAATSRVQLPQLTAHSRTTSCTSTPSLSPQTPQLSRSDSSDSRAFSTPSPLTPSFDEGFGQAAAPALPSKHPQHHRQQYYLANNHYAKMDDQNASMYPPIPDATGAMPTAYPMPAQMVPQQSLAQQSPPQNAVYRGSNSPSSEPSRVSTVSQQSNNKNQPKKNQYPCPMAKQVGCTDFFTTSGHAARHAKKHTGKKDAFCPECNKAFTRKDNMEQHRRTHQNGRGSSRSTDDSKVKKATKPAKKTAVKVEPHLEVAVEQQLADQAQAAQVQSVAQAVQAQQVQQQQQQQAAEAAMLAALPQSGPYFLNTMDPGPVPALPMAMPELNAIRPQLHRSNFTNSLEFVPPAAPMIDPDTLHYSYPSPGLSNGLNSLALAASEHSRRMSDKSHSQSSRSPSESSHHETP
ncbi:hypothetical protein DOTSEDRAFT_68933 [Dothistroma septosporum NZE10]|uniref:C2H2-type domain-containing protein n=1 Tax=Dothistroma septosporum (strain NZE10 / CBS 128990) TaxID=675120 RepID=N1Q4G6_DOTSN|nr:hypothetical protein DOTSEDRAFT_68933 [Dothistroma septosporum NZE10]